MTHRKTLAALALLLGVAACGDNKGATTEPVIDGELSMTLRRAAASTVPSLADSALIRVWHPTAAINQVKAVAVPAPGTETRVSFSLPSQSGYSVAVLAFKRSGSYTHLLAGGRTDAVNVAAGQPNEAAVSVLPWQMAITGPDTLTSGLQANFTFTLSGGAYLGIMSPSATVAASMQKWTADANAPTSGASVWASTPGQYQGTVSTPTVNADTALYMQPVLYLESGWQANNRLAVAYVPSLTLGGTLFRRPIKVPGGTLTVVFDKRKQD